MKGERKRVWLPVKSIAAPLLPTSQHSISPSIAGGMMWGYAVLSPSHQSSHWPKWRLFELGLLGSEFQTSLQCSVHPMMLRSKLTSAKHHKRGVVPPLTTSVVPERRPEQLEIHNLVSSKLGVPKCRYSEKKETKRNRNNQDS